MMVAAEIADFITSDSWEWQFDSLVIAQGRKLLRGHDVGVISVKKSDTVTLELEASVSGTGSDTYQVEVVIWEQDGDFQVEGMCNCDFANQCQHAAGILLAAAKPKTLEKIREVCSLDSSSGVGNVELWIDKVIDTAVQSECAPITSLVYYIFESVERGIVLRLRTAKLKADGVVSDHLAEPRVSKTDFPLAFSRDDRVLCRELLSYPSLGGLNWLVEGEGFDRIVRSAVETGRAFWQRLDGKPLRFEGERSGFFGWKENVSTVFPIIETKPQSDCVVLADRLLAFDGAENQVCQVVCTEGDEKAAIWMKGPEVNHEDAEEVGLILQQKGLTGPQKVELQDSSIEPVYEMHIGHYELTNPSIRHQLKLEDERISSARVWVNYGGSRFSLVQKRNAGVEKIGDKLIARDLRSEGQAIEILQRYGLVNPLLQAAEYGDDLGAVSNEESALWLNGLKQFTAEQYWTSFQARRVDELREAGWKVSCEEASLLEPLLVDEKDLDVELESAGDGWFALSAGFVVEGRHFELQPILADLLEMGALTPGSQVLSEEFFFYYPEGRSEVLKLPSARMRVILGVLKGLLLEFTGGRKIEIPVTEAAVLVAESDILKSSKSLKALGKKLKNPDMQDKVDAPQGLMATLREYQEEGFQWMQFLARHELNGILADDMGLGKTLQTLAHVLADKERGSHEGKPSLVLAPTSVVYNWRAEAKKWAPSLKVLVLQGAKRKKLYAQIPQADLVVTSYALLARDIDLLKKYHFHIAALDEAQHIKNPQAKVSKAARELKASHRLCLSGTPIENNLGELWSLMAFLMPGILGAHDDFTAKYRTPIEKHQDEEAREKLVSRVGPLILRRTKNQVAKELPPKTEIIHTIELNEPQKDLYETVRALMDKRVRDAIAAAGMESSQILFLDALLKLRQICCHPQLLDKREAQKVEHSAKLDHLTDMLETMIAEGRKILLFSQFTTMLEKIETEMSRRGYSYLKLTGESKDRQGMVDVFQQGETDVFLISLKAGGTGLTLTAADTVIHFDPWWNPAAEAQATDRAYRIGQDKPVFVHKLICKDTVEQRIQELQSSKAELADALLSGSAKGLSLDADTIERLLAPVDDE